MSTGTKPKSLSPDSSRMSVWGITGGAGSGKSAVGQVLREKGYLVLDADQLARDLRREGGQAHPLILAEFGTTDPKELRAIIYGDASKRKKLEQILHPLISQAARDQFAAALASNTESTQPVHAFYEAALLIETGRYLECDGVWLVRAPRDLRIERLVQRDGITTEAAEAVLAAQISDEKRVPFADQIIDNDGPVDALVRQVDLILKSL